MDPKEPPRTKTRNPRISAYYEIMTENEADDLIDILASLIVTYLEKGDKQ